MDPWTRLCSPVEVRALLPASPEEVYAVLAEPTTYPRWLVGAQRIRDVDPDFPRPSARFEHSVGPSDGATVDDDTRALVDDEPHRLVLEVHAGPATGTVEFLLDAEGAGTRLRFREQLAGRLAAFTPVLRPLLYARNAESMRRLRAHLRRPSPA